MLVSASGDEMVRPIGELLGVTDVIATRMSIVDGRYSGEVEFYAAGPSKVEGVREMAAERGYDLAECYAYSDSSSDLPLLEAVGHPSAVNPDRALRRVAIENAWPMLEFRHPVPLGRRLRDRPAVPVAAAALGVGRGRRDRHRDLRPASPRPARRGLRIKNFSDARDSPRPPRRSASEHAPRPAAGRGPRQTKTSTNSSSD